MLREILEEEGDIIVAGEASDGVDALSMVRAARPDLVTVDIDMPKMGGLATVKQIMAHHPVPILIVTGRPREQRTTTLFEAVQRGALDLAEKPTLGRRSEAQALSTGPLARESPRDDSLRRSTTLAARRTGAASTDGA